MRSTPSIAIKSSVFNRKSKSKLPSFKRKVQYHNSEQIKDKGKESDEQPQFVQQLKSIQLRPKLKSVPKLNIQRRSMTLTKVSFSPRNGQKKFQLAQQIQEQKRDKIKNSKLHSLSKVPQRKKGEVICLRIKKVDIQKFIKSDLQMLRKFPEIDMEAYVLKVKRQQYYRKKQNMKKWQNFKYSNIPI